MLIKENIAMCYAQNLVKVMLWSVVFVIGLAKVYPNTGFYTSNKFIFERLNSNRGLSSDEVNKIYQTSDGYIWFCSNDGLMRFDAYTFDVYKARYNDPQWFNSKEFVDICEDKAGNLWLGTKNDGVNVFNQKLHEVRIINEDKESGVYISNNNIKSIFCDSKGRVWIGCNIGINCYEPETGIIKNFLINQENARLGDAQTVRNITEDTQGHIWFGTWNMGLMRFNTENGSFERFYLPFEHETSQTHIRSLFIDSKQKIWVGTWGEGVFRVDSIAGNRLITQSFKYHASNQNTISGDIIHSIQEDNQGNIWVGSPYGLDIIIDPHSRHPQIIRKHTDPDDLNTPSSNVIFDIFKDNSGIMWLATLGDGVNIVDFEARKFESYLIPQINPQRITQTVHSIAESADGDLLIGVRSLGFLKYNRKNNTYQAYKDHPVFKKMLNTVDEINTAFCFLTDSKGYLWIGTRYNGFYRISEQTGAIMHISYDTLNSLSIRAVNCMLEDSRGQFWFGTDNGLYKLRFNNGSETDYQLFRYRNNKTNPLSISGNAIKTIYEDKSGVIWIGTDEKGLNRITNPAEDKMVFFKNYQVDPEGAQGLPHNDIYSIFQQKENVLWLGTGGSGLVEMDIENEVFTIYSVDDGLLADAVYDIFSDMYGTMWLTTNMGICRFDPTRRKGEQFEFFTIDDGLNSNILMKGAVCHTKDGFIFFGGHKGFNSFHPDDITKNKTLPLAKITQVNVFNTLLTRHVEANDRITLSHKDYSFSIEFTALSYSQPKKNMYAYKMENFDENWQYTTASNRRALYSNLRPGDYTFYVKAANNSGTWNNQPFALRFRVKPAPFFSWWAYLLYALLALFILIVVYRFLLSREKIKKDLEVEQIERVKSEKLNRFKLRFYTNISHELLTPLAILSATIEGYEPGKPFGEGTIGIMQRNINRLVKLIQQLLVFRKIETENLKLVVSKNDLAQFVTILCGNFAPLVDKKKISLHVDVPDEKLVVFFDEDKIDKILHNLLSNAFKYTPTGGGVKVGCSAIEVNGKDYFQLVVSDTGKGIPADKLDFIFERFTRLESEGNEVSGTGIGLELTKRLVELHNGEIMVASELGVGTTFTIQIPAYRSAYLEEQVHEGDSELARFKRTEALAIENEVAPTLVAPVAADELRSDGRKKLLLIEDNYEYRELLQQHLSGTYQVYEAENGKTGLEKTKKLLPDIVISDIMMPEMDGFEFCSSLKNTLEISHIPVILLSAKTGIESKTEGYETGADSYIEKPVNFKMLETRIHALIQQREKFKELFKTSLDLEPSKISVTSLDEKYFTRVKEIVEANIDNPEFNVAMLVSEMSTSNSMLYRKISSLTGMSPNEFIKIMRLKRAAQLLSEKKHNISEVAYITGFNNQSYFGVCFKKQFGLSPSEFVAQQSK